MSAPAKPTADWERIELDYRAGVLTLREIAAKHGITHGAVNKRAKRDGWSRDLSAAIKAKADALVSKQVVSAEVSKQRLVSERETIESNAQAIAAVKMRHREDANTATRLALDMLHELSLVTHSPEDLQALLRMASQGLDADDLAAVQQSFKDLLRLHNRVASVQKLADTLTKLQGLERRAWGLDDDEAGGERAGRVLTDVERAARVAAVIDKARAAKAAAEGAAP